MKLILLISIITVITFIIVITIYIILKIFKTEDFPQETVDQGNKIVNDTNLSLTNFNKNFNKIDSLINKSTIISDVYNKEKIIKVNYDNNVVNLVNKTKTLVNCADGNYVNSLNGNCETCLIGGSCTYGKFTKCNGLGFSDVTGLSQCKSCPHGTSSFYNNGNKCIECRDGSTIDWRKTPIEGVNDGGKCVSCGAGNYKKNFGTSGPNYTILCDPCPLNSYCPEKFSGDYSYTDLIDCPDGSYTDVVGAKSLSQCKSCQNGKIGYACNSDCNKGYYCNNTRNSNNEPIQNIYKCPAGTYNDKIGSTDISACIQCPSGKVSAEGSIQCNSICPDGYYSDGNKCLICPEGYSCTANIKKPCENGKWSSQGSWVCTSCPADSMCGNGVKKLHKTPEAKTDCVDGYIFDTKTSQCILCPSTDVCFDGEKKICNNTNGSAEYYDRIANKCVKCPYGYFCNNSLKTACGDGYITDDINGNPLTGQNVCNIPDNRCPASVICKNGAKTLCPPGTNTFGNGSTTCISCDQGYYRDSSSVYPTNNNYQGYCNVSTGGPNTEKNICPSGYICPKNSNSTATIKTKCAEGTYVDSTRTVCKPCDKGYACTGGIRTQCADNMNQTPANSTKCLLNDSEYCNASGDCVNNCCAKYAWYSIYDSCIPKGVTGYSNCK